MRFAVVCLGLLVGDLFAAPAPMSRQVTVALDGSGDFRSVQTAVDSVPEGNPQSVTVFIRKGRYEELVRIPRNKPNLRLLGEDRHEVVIVALNNDKLHPGVRARTVLGIEGDGCVVENLTVRNATPYKGSQAEAVVINADRCVLRRADFLSFQDTLNLNGRVYVEDCYVEGDVDYVWGSGAAVFDRCHLRTMHDGYVVQARNGAGRTGFVFLDCRLTAAPEAKRLYLARIESEKFPDSQVAFVRCSMPSVVRPEGWLVKGELLATLRFAEHAAVDEKGNALDLSARRGGRVLSAEQAAELTVDKLLAGKDGWKPAR